MNMMKFEERAAEIERRLKTQRALGKRLIRSTLWRLSQDPEGGTLLSEMGRRWGRDMRDDPEFFIAVKVIPLNSPDPDVEPTSQQMALVGAFSLTLRSKLLSCVFWNDFDRGVYFAHQPRPMIWRVSPLALRRDLYTATVSALRAFEIEWKWKQEGRLGMYGTALKVRP